MDELLKALCELLENGKLSDGNVNVKMTQDKDGSITLKYTAPQKSKEVEAIKAEIADMDDEVFQAAANNLKKSDPASFRVMSTIDNDNVNPANLVKAYDVFKRCVIEVVEAQIKALTSEVNRLYGKYLDKKPRK